jgi:hypothetical protein
VRQPEATFYPYGTHVRLTAIPNSGYYFVGWKGVNNTTTNPITVVMDHSPIIKATFVQRTGSPITLLTQVEGGGHVHTQDYLPSYPSGTVITNTAIADPDQIFLAWSGDTNAASFPVPTQFVVTMDTNRSVTAHFTSRPRLNVVRCLGGLTGEGFKLSVSGELNAVYAVQATDALQYPPMATPWTTLGLITNLLGLVEFVDTTKTNVAQRSYRAHKIQ